MSTYSKEIADWEGSGYGPMLMTPSVRLIVSLSLFRLHEAISMF